MPKAVRILLCAAVVGGISHGLYSTGGVGKPGLSGFFDNWVYYGVFLAAAVACVLRGVLVRAERLPWLLIAGGVVAWFAGDVYWTFHIAKLDEVPYPSFSDALYVAGYPLLYAGIAMLSRSRLRSVDRTLWLDGGIGALAVASVALAFLQPALAGTTEGDVKTIVVNLAYPLGDVVLLSLVVGAIALSGWRADAALTVFACGLAITGIADVIYLQQEATTGYVPGSWPDTMWLAGAIGIAGAAWAPSVRKSAGALLTRRQFVLPVVFALVAVAVQIYDHYEELSDPAIWLSATTLVVVAVRMSIFFERYATLLRRTKSEALTDALTGLGNRRALLNDLEETVESGDERLLAIFDLDGFKSYNDAFGHPAGDALLVRLGVKLATALRPYGKAYRLGGDEFCVLASLEYTTADDLLGAAAEGLSEDGEVFKITSSYGSGILPEEACEASEAMRLVDRRMYAQKGTRQGSAEHQTASVLLRTLHEREPELGVHIESVGHLAGKLARCLDLPGEDIDEIVRGAQLHDVGKMAIPDAILDKPGPLEEHEWKLMHGHTITGERIVASAPALLPVAKLVRSSHERWDGDGYPDGLAGEEIPLGARVITLCDAFQAMIEERPWQKRRTPAEAMDELHRCAGTQFDAALVDVFATRVFPQLTEPETDAPAPPPAVASV